MLITSLNIMDTPFIQNTHTLRWSKIIKIQLKQTVFVNLTNSTSDNYVLSIHK